MTPKTPTYRTANTHLHYLGEPSTVRHLVGRRRNSSGHSGIVTGEEERSLRAEASLVSASIYLQQGGFGGIQSGVTLHLQSSDTHTHTNAHLH